MIDIKPEYKKKEYEFISNIFKNIQKSYRNLLNTTDDASFAVNVYHIQLLLFLTEYANLKTKKTKIPKYLDQLEQNMFNLYKKYTNSLDEYRWFGRSEEQSDEIDLSNSGKQSDKTDLLKPKKEPKQTNPSKSKKHIEQTSLLKLQKNFKPARRRFTKYQRAEQNLYRLLSPLRSFLSMLAAARGDTDTYMYYSYKHDLYGGKQSLREKKCPLIYKNMTDDKVFYEINYWVDEKVLNTLMDPNYKQDKKTLNILWDSLDHEFFEYIISDVIYGSMYNVWSILGSKYNGFQLYIKSQATRSAFADYVASKLNEPLGKARASKIYNGRVQYNIVNGSRNEFINHHRTSSIHAWFQSIYYDKTTNELKESSSAKYKDNIQIIKRI